MNENSSQSGFTLIELLIVITLVAVLAAFSSSFSFLITRSAAQSSQMELIGFINTARTTAIMESTNVTLCPINTENGKCSSDWSRDIIAFRDPNRSRQLVDIKQIVRTLQPNSNGVFYGNAGIRKYFGFRATGIAKEAIGNIIWCPQDKSAENAFQIRINMGGRPRVAQDNDGDGVVENSQGNPISC
ncbi:GspH/FimT family pseudopilin [Marinobacter salexigens]|uniref:GspH/FimT family pseudopilin n=1 Tax=Marinobacter salexigens TaxID=1925763 RepID=UPI000C284D8F|nr:GspH/FimT family pseudopilin [Marinobacter salexigens]|tara:strand:+ start:731 stop:1291 length:561 start_codon:yes stop_codon:yes gene_type:complete